MAADSGITLSASTRTGTFPLGYRASQYRFSLRPVLRRRVRELKFDTIWIEKENRVLPIQIGNDGTSDHSAQASWHGITALPISMAPDQTFGAISLKSGRAAGMQS